MKPLNKPPSNQKAFDAVVQHFVVEGNAKSVSSDGDCRFRGIGSAVCAVGLLFPNRLYKPEMEATALDDVLRRSPKLSRWLIDTRKDFLYELQRWHDQNVDLQDPGIVLELKLIGERYRLDVTGIPQDFLPKENPDVET